MSQALSPVSAVNREDSNHFLLPKQVGGLGPCCPKTVCPSNSPSGSFQKLHIPILYEKSEKMMYDIAQYSNFHLKSSSSFVWPTVWVILMIISIYWNVRHQSCLLRLIFSIWWLLIQSIFQISVWIIVWMSLNLDISVLTWL